MTLAALILAGGHSRRMGQDKALLEIDGVSLLRRIWDIAQTVSPQIWVMTPHRDRYATLLPETTQWIPETFPPSGSPPAGPLVAFAQALVHVQADWVLLLACDLPALQVDVLQQWQQKLPQVPAEAIAYVPQRSGCWEPLCGFYRSTCLSSLQAYLAGGGRSFQHWLDHQRVEAITDFSDEMLTNCNTPEAWKKFRQA